MNLPTEVNAAQLSYEAYCNHTGWKSLVSGQALPQWHNLKPEIQAAWQAASVAVTRLHSARIGEIRNEAIHLCLDIQNIPASPLQTECLQAATSIQTKLNNLLPIQ